MDFVIRSPAPVRKRLMWLLVYIWRDKLVSLVVRMLMFHAMGKYVKNSNIKLCEMILSLNSEKSYFLK